jgi:competence protein FA
MFFREYCEFIEALYIVYYSKMSNNDKNINYRKIKESYDDFGEINSDFDEIYNEIMTRAVYTLKESDLTFLRRYNGLLLSIPKLLKMNIKPHCLDNCQYISKLYSVNKDKGKFHCLQCDNKDQQQFFTFVDKNQEVTYCRRCIDFGRSDDYFMKFHINIPILNLMAPDKPSVKLSDVQDEASKTLVENIENAKSTLIWAVCGAGKTEIVYDAIYHAILGNKNICLAIPRRDVVKELFERFFRDFSNYPISVLHGEEKILEESSFYIMTTHQLVKYYNYFDIVIIDEVDAFPYSGDECLENGAKTSLKDDGVLVFLSATPSEVVKSSVDEVVKIPIRYHRYLLPVPKIKIEKPEVFDFSRKSRFLEKFVKEKLEKDRRILIFVPEVGMCETAVLYFKKYITEEITIDFVYSGDENRSEKIQKFYNREIDVLITTTILERGVTFDYLDVVVFDAKHINFTKAALIQISGRVGRKDYDNSGDIVFLADNISWEMKAAIKEIEYMNNLAKYRKLNRR